MVGTIVSPRQRLRCLLWIISGFADPEIDDMNEAHTGGVRRRCFHEFGPTLPFPLVVRAL